MRAHIVFVAGAYLALAGPAAAMEFSFDAYVDARLVLPSGERSWVDGGLGKFRFGGAQPSPNFRIAEAVGQATLAIDDELHAISVLRLEPEQPSGLDILETYLSWRPAAHGAWRWSAKAGAFFPPVSIENDDLGWSSPYTLTPSAINSWVGDELRSIGGEGSLTWSGDAGAATLTGALICCNEPAGVLIAERGWTLDDRPMGLLERVRVPDATAALYGMPVPSRTGMFENIDGQAGWYAQFKWSRADWGEAGVLYYDNRADPAATTTRDSAWHTRFWSLSLRSRLAGATILAQAFSGDTAIGAPAYATYFRAAYLLASYDLGDWRLSARGDIFQVRNAGGASLMDEDGSAATAAVLWSAKSWLRLGAELIALDSRRPERVLESAPPQRSDAQFQVSARVFL